MIVMIAFSGSSGSIVIVVCATSLFFPGSISSSSSTASMIVKSISPVSTVPLIVMVFSQWAYAKPTTVKTTIKVANIAVILVFIFFLSLSFLFFRAVIRLSMRLTL